LVGGISKKEWVRIKVFSASVRRKWVRKGLTQDELAEKADIATRNLPKVEAGETNILLATAFRIQLGLRCPWKRLMPFE
jgi:transcriptional regulator with XRE-family HTH domain